MNSQNEKLLKDYPSQRTNKKNITTNGKKCM